MAFNHRCQRFGLFAWLLLAIALSSCVSFNDDAKYSRALWNYSYDLPDQIAVSREYKNFREKADLIKADSTNIALRLPRNDVLALLSIVEGLFRYVATGALTHDTWWTLYRINARQFYASVDWHPNMHFAAVQFNPKQKIAAGFESYTLYLDPNADFSTNSIKVKHYLFSSFMSLGKSIGDNHASVWFQAENNPTNIDELRSKTYCDKLGLSYNNGPYIVFTRKRPDLLSSGDEVVVIRLTNIDPNRIVYIINILNEDIRRGNKTRINMLLYEELKQRILSFCVRHSDLISSAIEQNL